MKTLTIVWQGLLDDGQTCPRCGSTESEVFEAIPTELIVKAGLLAAVKLLGREECDCYPATVWPGGGCCPK